jgi:molybdopterin molybdotransferase
VITPRQAHSLIARHARPLGAITVSLGAALGRVLSRDVRAKYPLPHFDNSAMDGYALRSNDTLGAGALSPVRLRLRRTVYAGDTRRHALRTGEACGIMTGAPVPRGADTIVPIERASTEEEYLVVTSPVSSGAHVRRRGEELEAGVTVRG